MHGHHNRYFKLRGTAHIFIEDRKLRTPGLNVVKRCLFQLEKNFQMFNAFPTSN